MNKNWDEIRGKAEQEQNVPTKNFTHDGTQYALTGDHQRAHSHFHEARAHLGKMKMVNVNNLPIISGIKYFDDGSVATFKVVHGKEDIHIVSPMAQLGGEIPPVPKKGVDEIEQIVPVMRSVDNTHWVACLSGTFEGPYYHFPNTFEIPAEAFGDNIEVDLDGQLISIGTAPIEDSITDPELFFIAQTGIRPDLGTGEALTGDISAIYDPRYDANNYGVVANVYFISLVGDEIHCEIEYYPWSYYSYDISFEYNDTFYITTTVWGEILAIPERTFSRNTTYEGEGASQYSVQPTSELNFWGEYYSLREYSVPTIVSTSVEREAVANFACCYAQTEIESTSQRDAVSATCAEKYRDDPPPYIENTVRRKPYYFQVNEDSYKFYDTPEKTDDLSSWELDGYPYRWSEYPPGQICYVEENMLKYYGPESRAQITGIMCGRVEDSEVDEESGAYINRQCLGFYYNYVGPRHDGISTVLYIPEAGQYEHIIPNVEGIDDTVLFKGEIFLGLIKYEIEA